MMFGTMREVGLFPPQYRTRPWIDRESVITTLLNHNRPSVWEQVTAFIEQHGTIANAEVRQMLGTQDTLTASKQLKAWVEQGLLVVANPEAGRNVRRYTRPNMESPAEFFSNLDGKEEIQMP